MAVGMVEVEMVVVAWAALVAEDVAAVADMVVGEMEVVALVAVGTAEVVLGEVGMVEVETAEGVLEEGV